MFVHRPWQDDPFIILVIYRYRTIHFLAKWTMTQIENKIDWKKGGKARNKARYRHCEKILVSKLKRRKKQEVKTVIRRNTVMRKGVRNSQETSRKITGVARTPSNYSVVTFDNKWDERRMPRSVPCVSISFSFIQKFIEKETSLM